jgi:hypothetical protein
MPDPPVVALNAAIRGIRRPIEVERLPIDERGFVVPWFVDWPNGKPDHRVVDGRKFRQAIKEQRCWLCGGRLGRIKASVIGPMCAVNRITSEPPCHPQCARYAVQACPFLSRPRARRNERNLPEERQEAAGMALDRNPGVSVIWESLVKSRPFNPMYGTQGTLFDLGPPYRVTWWREGHPATRYEAMASIRDGLPALRQVAVAEGEEAVAALGEAMLRALQLLPADEEA